MFSEPIITQIVNKPSFDVEEAKTFLDALGVKNGEKLHFTAFPDLEKPKHSSIYPELPIAGLKYQSEKGLGFGLIVNKGGRKASEITHCRAIFTESDSGIPKEQQLENLKKLPLQPTIIVDSGNKSLHAYWLSNELMDVAEWQDAQKALASIYKGLDKGTDGSLSDPNQLMRLPGSIHPKTGKVCRIIEIGESYPKTILLDAFKPKPTRENPSLVDTGSKVVRLKTASPSYNFSREALQLLEDADLKVEQLISGENRKILESIQNSIESGSIPVGKRSDVLTTIAKEFAGWQVFFDDNYISYDLKAEESFLEIAIPYLEGDKDRAKNRIWDSVNRESCDPAIAIGKDDNYIVWKIIRTAIQSLNGYLTKDLGNHPSHVHVDRNFEKVFGCSKNDFTFYQDQFYQWDGTCWQPIDISVVASKTRSFLFSIYHVFTKEKKSQPTQVVVERKFGSARQTNECVDGLKIERNIFTSR